MRGFKELLFQLVTDIVVLLPILGYRLVDTTGRATPDVGRIAVRFRWRIDRFPFDYCPPDLFCPPRALSQSFSCFTVNCRLPSTSRAAGDHDAVAWLCPHCVLGPEWHSGDIHGILGFAFANDGEQRAAAGYGTCAAICLWKYDAVEDYTFSMENS
jgi:hypothetical protein